MGRAFFRQLVDQFGAERIADVLAPFISDRRKEKIQEVIASRLLSLELAFEAPSDMHNALAAVRTAEALGVTRIHLMASQLSANSPSLKKRVGRRSATGAMHWVDLKRYPSTSHFFDMTQGTLVAAATPYGTLTLDELPVDRPLCLLFGNEHAGLTDEALAKSDLTFRVPMYGMVQSLNLSVCAAICLHEMARKRRSFIGKNGDLSGEVLFQERAFAYAHSVGFQTSYKILTATQLR